MWSVTFSRKKIKDMGSAISSLPEKLNENEMKTICGIHYEAPLFQSLRDPTDGLVRKDFFLGFFLFLISFSFLSFNSYFYLSFFSTLLY